MQFIAHDTQNDVAIIKTTMGFQVRYGLQITLFACLTGALDDYRDCVSHAISSNFDL